MLNVVNRNCGYCKKKTPEKTLANLMIKTLPENKTFGGRLKIVECRICGLRYLNPSPDPTELHKIYDFDVYEDSTNSNPVLQEYFYDILKSKCKKIESVLEIGCGTGDFLAVLEKNGIEVAGVEFAESSKRVKFNGQLYVGRMEDIDIKDRKFDAVLMLNVMEHLDDPMYVLKKAYAFLADGGVLVMRNPNSDLFFNPVYRYLMEIPKYLVHLALNLIPRKTRFTVVGFQSQHLFYFNKNSMRKMLDASGFNMEYFTTADPFNRYRFGKALREFRLIEAGIAGTRHILGFIGLGPECIVVARRKA